MFNYSLKDIIYKKGIFPSNFPIKDAFLDEGESNISKEYFEDIVYVSDNFDFHFHNAGCMRDGVIDTKLNLLSVKIQ